MRLFERLLLLALQQSGTHARTKVSRDEDSRRDGCRHLGHDELICGHVTGDETDVKCEQLHDREPRDAREQAASAE